MLQKSKIESRQKSRESRFLSVSIAEGLLGIDTKVRGRFCVKRYGPSCREARRASAVLKISVDQPKNTFATKSAKSGSRTSFDHFVGQRQHVWRNGDPELFCRLEVHHQPELAGLLDWHVAGLCALGQFWRHRRPHAQRIGRTAGHAGRIGTKPRRTHPAFCGCAVWNTQRSDRLCLPMSSQRNSVMTWKLTLLVLASAAMLASTPASARHHRHGHFYFHGGQRYYSSPSAPGGGMLTPSAAWNH